MLKKIAHHTKNLTQKLVHFPIQVKFISFSLFLFMIGWGLGTDTYFSLYVESIIGNPRGVTAIGTILALAKLVLVIPIGNLNDHMNIKYLLLIGKILYVVCAVLFFFAGLMMSWELLILATLLNGFASATTFTTYRSYYGKIAKKHNQNQIFGAYFCSFNGAQILGALISAWLVSYLELSFMYFFVAIFALVSLLQDQKIRSALSASHNRSRYQMQERMAKEYLVETEETEHFDQHFLGEEGFLKKFINECFSLAPRKRIGTLLKSYNAKIYVALGSMFLVNLLNYVGFLFIPIVAMANHLTLTQIAIVFAVMRVPYLINIFTGKLGDKYNKKLLISVILLFISVFYVLLGLHDDFVIILILTFVVALGIAFLFPLTSALVSSYTDQKDKGVMTGAQDFVGKMGEIAGSLGFGALSAIVGIKTGFIVIGICVFGLGLYLFVRKLLQFHISLEKGHLA
ncbi:MAG: MFS transporter [Candidatus Peribacteria bacterium]|nr:MFS transporter [Candidatus Peribacteria bacterium]